MKSQKAAQISDELHIHQKGGWVGRDVERTRHTIAQAGQVVNAGTDGKAKVKVNLDLSTLRDTQPSLDAAGIVEVHVFDPLTPEQRAGMGEEAWAEWAPPSPAPASPAPTPAAEPAKAE